MIRQELQTHNQESETAKRDHNLLDEDQNLQNHVQAHSESIAIEVVESHPRETGDDWVISVKDKLEQAHTDNIRTSTSNLCIYKVPHYLYEKNEKSYFPQTVSIGPYHYGKEHLQAMECHKWRAVDMILQRTHHDIGMYIYAMKEGGWCWPLDWYEGPVHLRDNKFTEMLVVDGCFVLELLEGACLGFHKIGYAPTDPVFAIGGLMHSIKRDMLMLENQIPFSMLCRLAEVQERGLDVRKLAAHFFDPFMPTTSRSFTNKTSRQRFIIDEQEFVGQSHCLDLFRRRLLEGIPQTQSPEHIYKRDNLPMVADKRQQRMIHCVTELRDAGFKFRVRETNKFWDIQFNNGYLEIPKLLIHDGTKSLFLNLIAYEQRRMYSSNYITSYLIFMDNLIVSAEDIHYLRRHDIIQHSLGSDSEVADMFNGLCHEVVFNTNDIYLSGLLDEVDRCYRQKYFRKWNTWTRTLNKKYFDNPWAYLSFFAALILLFLTSAQTYFAAYYYFKPSS